MPLTAGTRLGSYVIEAPLGAGGMGEVYRARDTTLAREVAIKILPDLYASDPDRLTRFEREAHLLASLNHPNIAQVYGVEKTPGSRALVMELVSGPMLQEVIPTLSIAEVSAIARQIAVGLEAAHEQGIVHRDLKPANVKVRDDGTVKILDFGLAKALGVAPGSSADAMNSPTLTVRATQMGMVIGTAAYMAPEQARGKAVDRRADIWAFGAVLYEMLAGSRAFEGDTISDTIAAVLTKDPDWTRVRADAPASLVEVARRCLRKDPRQRPQAIGDVRIAIEEGDGAGGRPYDRPRSQRGAWALGIAAVLVLLAGAGGGWIATRWATPPTVGGPRVVPMHLAAEVPLALEEAPAFALSRDGSTLAFVGGYGQGRQLYVRPIGSPSVTSLPGTDGASSPFFSPDGQWLAFVADSSLKKVRVSGGQAPLRLAAATDRGGAWLDDDTIVYAQDRVGPLFRVASSGGQAAPLSRSGASSVTSQRFPSWIPGRDALLFTARSADGPAILAHDLRTGEEITVLAGAYHPVYSAPDQVLFMRDHALFSVPFDVDRLRVSGIERRIAEGLRATPEAMAGQYAAAGALLLYQTGELGTLGQGQIAWRDTAGEERPLLDQPDTYRDPRFSPDGRRLAYSVLPPGRGTDLWVLDLARGLRTRLTFDPDAEWAPVWSPDGLSIAFATMSGIRLMRADGSGQPQRLTENAQQWQVPVSFSPDGAYLAYYELHRETSADIWILPLAEKGEPRPFLVTPFYEARPVFSPNGRWIAYASNESGSFQVYVRPFPGPGARHQISGDRTLDVHDWSADGTKLFYRSGDGRRMMAVPVRTDGAEFEYGEPSALFELDPEAYPDRQFWGSFAAAPDGSGFALVKAPLQDASARSHLMLMLDWRQAR